MEALGGNNAGFGFSAQPQVVQNQGPYRDPYREYVKIAPQNIMYDRRVVRGNTFAALVIPVNMQPDPALIEKQKMEQMMNKQRLEQLRKRKEDDMQRSQMMQEEEQRRQMMDLQQQNPWEELSDHENMIDEEQLEPDYYIDRPPSPIYIPNPEGENKVIQVNDKDPDLFDFEIEAEPILQVLVGKALELAQIEVLEEFELQELARHKKMFLQIKEAELMETQRVQAARKRRVEETERRNLQQRTSKNQRIWAERKIIARTMAKEYLLLFQRDTLNELKDEGILRRPVDFSLETHFIPQLYGQIEFDLQSDKEYIENLDSLLNFCMRGSSKTHRDAMIKEYKRREEKKKEQLRLQKEQEEQKRKRKEERAAARERFRIQQLLEKIQYKIIGSSNQEDYNPQHKIYDIRDPNGKKDGLFLIGGFVGELIITFTCLLDYILANPQNQNFMFTQEGVENYLRDLLVNENFTDGILTLHLARDPTLKEKISSNKESFRESSKDHSIHEEEKEYEKLQIDDDTFMRFSLTKSNITDYGLSFFFEVIKDLVISKEFIEILYRVIIKIVRTHQKPIHPVPEMPLPDAEGNDLPEEEKKALHHKIDEIIKENQEAEKFNEEISKIQAKVKIAYRQMIDFSQANECALMRVNNHRENKEDNADVNISSDTHQQHSQVHHQPTMSKHAASQKLSSGHNTARDNEANSENASALDNFSLEEIPTKMILIDPTNHDDINLIVYHAEAQFAVRKVIIDVARRHFKELEKLNMNAVLAHTAQKSKQLDERFEDHIIRTLKFGRGQQFNDKNLRITWKTFLQY